jgi:outer membrane cobalamin receptor
LPPVIIAVDQEPLIRKDETTTGFKLLPADIKYSTERDIKELATRSSSVYQKREGGSLNIRGGRANATQFIVDGMKMTGDFSLPKAAIKEMFVITGGIPAMYGNVTGGIVVITTKSYSDFQTNQ